MVVTVEQRQTGIFEIPLAEATSLAAMSWNTGLLLGVVSEICHQIGFDPTNISLNCFRNCFPMLRQAAFASRTTAGREELREPLEELANFVDGVFGSEYFADLMAGWPSGETEIGDLEVATVVPPQLVRVHRSLEESTPPEARIPFRAGVLAGEAFILAHYEAGAFLAKAPTRSSAEFFSEFGPGGELRTALRELFECQKWQAPRWDELDKLIAESRAGADVHGEVSMPVLLSWDLLMPAPAALARASLHPRVVAALHAAFARVSLAFSGDHNQPTETPPGECGYLEITLGDDRVATRQGFAGKVYFSSALQWNIFKHFVNSAGEQVAREQLYKHWEGNTPNPNSVEQITSKIRDLIKPMRLELKTVRGIGWRLLSKNPNLRHV